MGEPLGGLIGGDAPAYRASHEAPRLAPRPAPRGPFRLLGGAEYHDLDEETRQRLLKERRNVVLWLRGIEWDTEPSQVAERGDLRPGVFPFAGNGAGDSFAFYPTWQGELSEPPVIFVPHDEPTSRYFAPTFALALYRLWLEMGADWDADYDGDDRESALRAWAGILSPILAADARAELEALAVDVAAETLAAARDAFLASLPAKELRATLPPTKYNPVYVKGEQARRLYDESIAFYEALVAEGHARFAAPLEETRRNREAALAG